MKQMPKKAAKTEAVIQEGSEQGEAEVGMGGET